MVHYYYTNGPLCGHAVLELCYLLRSPYALQILHLHHSRHTKEGQ